jgi:hypothetical protein
VNLELPVARFRKGHFQLRRIVGRYLSIDTLDTLGLGEFVGGCISSGVVQREVVESNQWPITYFGSR